MKRLDQFGIKRLNMDKDKGISTFGIALLLVSIAIVVIMAFVVFSGALFPNTQTQPTESLTITSGHVVDNTHISIYIENTGSEELTLTSVFVDGTPVSAYFVTNPLPPGENVPVSLSDPTATWLGSSHTIKIVASDGTNASYTVN
jgi:archaellum component FlaF (FlaF/FlaG flagellin family)